MIIGPGKLQRLMTENRKMKALGQRTDRIRLLDIEGQPPERYFLRFHCRSIMEIDAEDQPVMRDRHDMEIYLTADYPRFMPWISCQTPIWHPNMNQQGNVCVKWSPQQNLADLCIVLAEMLQYKIYESTSPLNLQAAMWAMCHREELPLEDESVLLKEVGEVESGEVMAYSASDFIKGRIPILPEFSNGEDTPRLARFCGHCGADLGSFNGISCRRCHARRKLV